MATNNFVNSMDKASDEYYSLSTRNSMATSGSMDKASDDYSSWSTRNTMATNGSMGNASDDYSSLSTRNAMATSGSMDNASDGYSSLSTRNTMATNGSTDSVSDEYWSVTTRRSTEATHVDRFERCMPCRINNKDTYAVSYCIDCGEYICKDCIKNHNTFAALRLHQIVDLDKAVTAQPPLPRPDTSSSTDHIYLASLQGIYDVTVGNETACDISGSCLLSNGTLLIADSENRRLKRMNQCYAVTDWCELSGKPYAVCASGPAEVAVTLSDKRIIQFVSLCETMTATKSFSVGEPCHGIAYSNGELFVSSGGSWNEGPGQVQTYNTAGQLLRTFYRDAVGRRLFSLPFHIAASDDGAKLHVADKEFGIITLNRQGKLLSQFSNPDLKITHGVCLDDKDQLLVCAYISHNVIQISRGCHKLVTLLDQSNGTYYPQSLTYDRVNSRLIVTMASNNIAVFQLTKK